MAKCEMCGSRYNKADVRKDRLNMMNLSDTFLFLHENKIEHRRTEQTG